MLAQFENGRKFDCKKSLQDFDAKEKYLHPKNRPVSIQSDEKCSVCIIVECSHDAVSNLCRLGFRFQNLPFSKSAGERFAVFRVNRRPIRHIFHRFQNVPASYERSLRRSIYDLILQQKLYFMPRGKLKVFS